MKKDYIGITMYSIIVLLSSITSVNVCLIISFYTMNISFHFIIMAKYSYYIVL